MLIDDYIAVRWGHTPNRLIGGVEDQRRRTVRLRTTWNALKLITGSDAPIPSTYEVHSPRALPAVVTLRGERRIVWDAGLGTLCDALSFGIPYAQPAPVNEAIVHKIVAVRCTVFGLFDKATDHVIQAETLLAETPIDRYHQIHIDPEGQFAVWLLTEMQEQFALGHELAHYLYDVDPNAFKEFADKIEVLANTFTGQAEPSTIFATPYQDLGLNAHDILSERGLDKYDWFLEGWRRGECLPGADTTGPYYLESLLPPFLKYESTCDIISGLVVSLAAHRRGNGWSAPMAAATSRLALASLGMIMAIDEWVDGREDGATKISGQVAAREKRLDALLPQMLVPVLAEFGDGSALNVGDVRGVMLFAGDIHKSRLSVALEDATRGALPSNTGALSGAQILSRAGFKNLRPSADSRDPSVSGQKFFLGELIYSARISELSENSDFRRSILNVLARHHDGDWGDLPFDDSDANDQAIGAWFEGSPVSMPGPLYSMYSVEGESVWVITRADRLATNVLLTEEM